MRLPLSSVALIVTIFAKNVVNTSLANSSSSQSTPTGLCNKPPVNNCNCQCRLAQNSQLSNAVKALEKKLENLTQNSQLSDTIKALEKKLENLTQNSQLSDAMKGLEKKLENLIALVNKSSFDVPKPFPPADAIISSCKEQYERDNSSRSQVYNLTTGNQQIPVYCHMGKFGNFGCGDGGWTMVMKMDGMKRTFHYNSILWSNMNAYNPAGGQSGFDKQETKLPTYWHTPFSTICLGMRIGTQLNLAVINRQATSLSSLIADGSYRATSLNRTSWKSLIGSAGSLQTCCNRQGFNVASERVYHAKNMAQRSFARIATVIAYQLCWVTTVYGGCSNSDEKVSEWRVAEFERKETDKALRNHVISSMIVRCLLECSLGCLRHAQCESYNYEEEGQQHLCELNDRTALMAPRDLLRRRGFSFYDYGMNPCLNVICQNGGTCHGTLRSLPASYCCHCDQHYQGDVCQHFKGFRFTNHSFRDRVSIEVERNADIDSLSVCLRFKSSGANLGISTLISYLTNDTEAVFQLHMNRAVRIIIKNHYSDFPFVSLLDGTWHHVCFTWENNDGNLTLYTDGLLIGQKQGVHQQLTFDSAGILDVGNFALNKSYLGDITDINAWTSVLTPSVINKQSRECFSEEGDLLAWSSVSAPYLQFGNELEVDSIPTECKGFDPSATYDLEFPRRTKKDYVLLPRPTLPSLAAFTISLFVSFTDAGSKTYLNYFAPNAFNEIFIYERNGNFVIRLKQEVRSHNFVVASDGLWHHVAVTWDSINGSYEIFVDGQTKGGGKGLVNGTTIEPAGTFVVGNDKDSGDYQSRDAFVGNISRINIWDYVLSRETITLVSRRCGLEIGEILAWKDIKGGSIHGEVYIQEPSSCEIPDI